MPKRVEGRPVKKTFAEAWAKWLGPGFMESVADQLEAEGHHEKAELARRVAAHEEEQRQLEVDNALEAFKDGIH